MATTADHTNAMSVLSSPATPTVSSALFDVVRRQSTARIVGVSATALVAIAIGNYASAQDLSFAPFFLLPVLLAASKTRRVGLAVAGASACTWVASDVAARETSYDTLLIPVWNAGARFLVFWLVVALASALTRSLAAAQQGSLTDPLSGLGNARAFHAAAEAERRRMARTREPVTVAYIDVDEFKRINDRFGHSEGDRVITAIGDAICDTVREVDTVARLGGDEFAVLFPGTDDTGAARALRRVHDRLNLEAAARTWPIGFSIGAVTFTDAPPTVEEMVAEADRVMYQVKRDGKRAVRCIAAA